MGREVRMVPGNWQHPKEVRPDGSGRFVERYKPLFEGDQYQTRVDKWDEECAKWKRGEFPDYADEANKAMTYEQWAGQRPHNDKYMPNWPADQLTHLMMYENTSEGTPISPAFETPEELARWLVDNNASAFADMTASYEHWLKVARGGYAPSMAVANGHVMSGVEAASLAKE